MRITSSTVAAVAAGVLVLPATASAAVTQQVHDDGGTFVAMAPGLTISNMEPRVTVSAPPEDGEKYYQYSVVGPNGAAVATDSACLKLKFGAIARIVNFVGNGTYTMTTSLFSDSSCSTPVAGGASGSFVINAGAVVQTPTTTLLTRDAGSFSTKSYAFPAAVSPNGRQQILYRKEGVFDPVTGISGATITDSLFASSGQTTVSFREPGRYLFTTRAGAGSPQAFTAWSAPQYVNVKAPFDLSTSRWLDARGPSYRVRLQFREARFNGRVKLRVRKTSGGRYKTIGTVKARNGVITKRFTLRRSGRYQLRVETTGSSLVAPGRFTLGFRITRRII